jgi:hypothetical protein
MIKRNIKTIIYDVLCFIYLFKFFMRLKLYDLKALHTKHCFSLYYSFINSSYVLAARNAVFFASVSTGVQFIFMYQFYQAIQLLVLYIDILVYCMSTCVT